MQYIIRTRLLLLTFLLLCGLTGCSFHLAGTANVNLPFLSVILNTAQPYSAFRKQLKRSLRVAKVNIVEHPTPNTVILVIISDQNTVREFSTSGNGQNRQKIIRKTVHYQLQTADQHNIGGERIVTAQRMFTQSQDQMLGSDNDETRLGNQIAQACAHQLLLQLQAEDVITALSEYDAKHSHKKN